LKAKAITEGKDITIRYNSDGTTPKEICGLDIETDLLVSVIDPKLNVPIFNSVL
jgi:hypothetical protein